MNQIGRDKFPDLVELCAELVHIWDVDDEEVEELDKEFEIGAYPTMFVRTAWILSEIAEDFGIIFRKLKQRYPMLHKRLADRAKAGSDQQTD